MSGALAVGEKEKAREPRSRLVYRCLSAVLSPLSEETLRQWINEGKMRLGLTKMSVRDPWTTRIRRRPCNPETVTQLS